ncbi:lysostaphin resistance A-like protein [Halomicrococcus sp. NG-SE-24]|uniref:CPBP family intramembrane glutamic endopeptidase n=1 Tax=Halomicrococcus sp. NG-SE-24 TaxID=3436928 RepID=UPI003D95D289
MSKRRAQLRAVGIGILLVVGAYLIGQVVVTATALILRAAGIPVLDRPTLLLGISVVMLQGVTFGGVALVYLLYRRSGLSFIGIHIPSLREIGLAIGGFLALLAAQMSISITLTHFGIRSAQNTIVDVGNQNPTVFLLLIPASFLLIGPGEELLNRGLVQGVLREHFQPLVAISLTSILFAVIHVFSLQGQGKFVYLGIVFVLSLILGATYEYTNNLIVPAFIHGAYNATLFGIQYLTATGMV